MFRCLWVSRSDHGEGMLEYIITSKTRRKVLGLFFHNLDATYYLRNIVRLVNEEVNAVKRELDILVEGKVLKREQRLNKVFYSLNPQYVFYDDFVRIFAKMTPFAGDVYKKMKVLGKVKYIALSHAFIRKASIPQEEIYILFVGVIVLPEVSEIIKKEEEVFGRDINFTVMTEDELQYRKKNNDPFIWNFLKQPKVMLFGNEDGLMK